MRRCLPFLLTLLVLGSSGRSQDIVRPREFTLLRPQEPAPAPFIMAPINVQPLAQKQWNWTANNPQPITLQPVKPQAIVPQGNFWRGDQYQTWNFQSHNWNANVAPRTPDYPIHGAVHQSLERHPLGW